MSRPAPLAEVEAALVEHFAQLPSRASVSFLGVEAIEVLRFDVRPGERAYVSLGMSRWVMTAATETVRAVEGPRAEVMLHVRDPVGRFGDVWRRVAVLAAAPTVESVVYTEGMTVDLGEPLAAGSPCTGVVVARSAVPDVSAALGPVTILQVLAATSTELARARVRGGVELLELWRERDVDLLDLAREAVLVD